ASSRRGRGAWRRHRSSRPDRRGGRDRRNERRSWRRATAPAPPASRIGRRSSGHYNCHLQDSPPDDLDAIAERVLAAAADGQPCPDVAAFLARRYVSAPRRDVGDALGTVLARALDAASASTDTAARAAWLSLFCDVAAIADDERVHAAAQALVDRLHAG